MTYETILGSVIGIFLGLGVLYLLYKWGVR